MKYIFLLCCFWGFSTLQAQVKLDDFGRIVINGFLPDNLAVPAEAKAQLLNKLNQITTSAGMGGSQANARFVITASISIGTKDIIPGPPQMIAQNLDVTFYVGDALSKTLFSSTTLSLKGVGTNENKAFIEAFKGINPKNKALLAFLEEGKKKILDYYVSQCDFLLKNAQTMAQQQKYEEAIYQLALVPEVCQDCYFKALDMQTKIYQTMVDEDGKVKLNRAKTTWAAAQNPQGAEQAADILATINPNASCQPDVTALIKTMQAKIKADEAARWAFKLKQYEDKIAAQKEQRRIAEQKSIRDDQYRENQAVRDDKFRENQAKRNLELDKINSNNAREIAVEYARNQPKTVTYNTILWR